MSHSHRLKPGNKVRLDDITTKGKKLHDDRKAAEEEFFELRPGLSS